MNPKPAELPAATHQPSSPVRRVNLALQGGGSHGAFTWGVLDELLKDERIEIDGVSGASAGAVNAVALAHGFAAAARDGRDAMAAREAARATLSTLWQRVAAMGSLGSMAEGISKMMMGYWSSEKSGRKLLGKVPEPMDVTLPIEPAGHQPLAPPAAGRD